MVERMKADLKESKQFDAKDYGPALKELRSLLSEIESLYMGAKDKSTLQKSISLMGQISALDLPIEMKIAEITKAPKIVTEGLKKTWAISKSSKTFSRPAPRAMMAQFQINPDDLVILTPEIISALLSDEGMNKRYIEPFKQAVEIRDKMYGRFVHRPCRNETEALNTVQEMDAAAAKGRQNFTSGCMELAKLMKDPRVTPEEKERIQKCFQTVVNHAQIMNKKLDDRIKVAEEKLKTATGPERIVLLAYLRNLNIDKGLTDAVLERGKANGVTPQKLAVALHPFKKKTGIAKRQGLKMRNDMLGLLEKYGTSISADTESNESANGQSSIYMQAREGAR